MSIVDIVKNTKVNVKFKIFDSYETLIPVDLSNGYIDFICAITENGRLLIEKKYSTNDIDIITDSISYKPYIICVKFNPEDTVNLNINPINEERQRVLELFSVDNNRKSFRLIKTDFYLEGSGYYVR